MTAPSYRHFLLTRAKRQWQRIGVHPRSGVSVPLFSLYSKRSIGVGEFPDLEPFADWAAQAGLSIVQLLPLNDTGFGFKPYDAQCAFALEPMHLALGALTGIPVKRHQKAVDALRKKYPAGVSPLFNLGIKRAKLDLAWRIFAELGPSWKKSARFRRFAKLARYWLADYAFYRVLKEKFEERPWWEWPAEYRTRKFKALKALRRESGTKINFFIWLQWQLFEQFSKARKKAAAKDVLFLGDLPFLVSKDSAGVWARPEYFKLNYASGAPPDYYAVKGQRWGMPPYDWQAMAHSEYDYLIERLRYAQNFFDLYRVDHAIGLFRLWTIPESEPLEEAGLKGAFDPPEEWRWEKHGRALYEVMLNATRMLPVAEDLGTIPDCNHPVLAEMGIPGSEIQRWAHDPTRKEKFLEPYYYRSNSVASLSTHDTSTLAGWWNLELSLQPDIKARYWRFLGGEGDPPLRLDAAVARKAIETVASSASIFSIQMMQDWLSIEPRYRPDPPHDRINVPGTIDDSNWRYTLPYSIEELEDLALKRNIRAIQKACGRG